MKEQDFLKIINKTLTNNSFLGDDCAYLEDLGLFITHDTLVEDVHFKLDYATPFQIGYKAVCVNISDLASNLAIPKYISVSVSLPKSTTCEFVEKLYDGINSACEKYNISVIGGDLTGADKVIISICAIGKKQSDFCAKRNFAQVGDVIITTGVHGSSAAGLRCLLKNIDNEFLIDKHLIVEPCVEHANELANKITQDFACMDTSDGLFDALNQIAHQSNVSVNVDMNLIPYHSEIKLFNDYEDFVLFGGEDYQLLCCLSENDYSKLDKNKFFKIGEVIPKSDFNVYVNNKGCDLSVVTSKLFEHFLE